MGEDTIHVSLKGARTLMECDVPYKRKEEFKVKMPMYDWNKSDSVWEVPLIYLDEIHSMDDVEIESEVAQRYNKYYGGERNKIESTDVIDFDLYDHQKVAVGEMIEKDHFLLAMDMGTGKCLRKDNRIYTNKGYMTAEKIFNKFSKDKDHGDSDGEWWNAESDLKVASLEDGEIVWKSPEYIYREQYRGKMRRVTLSDGSEITITFSHPLLTPSGWRSDIEEGDTVAVIEELEKLTNMDVQWAKIEEIEKVEYDDYIYDLTVPETHNFVAEDILVHNTASTISALLELKERDELYGNGEALIVVPSALKREWEEEINDNTDASYTVIDGGPDERPDQWNEDTFFKIVNYALLRYDDYPNEAMWGAVAIDEASKIKNYDSERTELVQDLNAPRRYALTGTPIENDVSDLFNIMHFLNDDMFLNYFRFQQRYLETEDRKMGQREWTEVTGTKNLEELKKKVRPVMYRVKKEEVLDDLPPITTKNIYVDMTEEQEKEYKRIKDDMYDRIEKEKEIGAHIQYLSMLANSTEMINRSDRNEIIPFGDLEKKHPKIDALKDLMEKIQRHDAKAIMFTQWSTMVEIIMDELPDDLTDDVIALTGDNTEKERKEGLQEFEDEKSFLLATDIFQQGANLQFASYIIHIDPLWNPQAAAQRRDRVHRIGQESAVTQINIISEDSIEESIEETQSEKRDLFDRAINDIDDVDPEDLDDIL